MNRPTFIGILLAGLILTAVAFTLHEAAQAGEKSDTKVKAIAKATKPGADGKQVVTITIDIDKGWYIHANPVGNDEYKLNATKIAVKAGQKVGADFVYPTGRFKQEGKMYIYEDRVTIKGEIQRAPATTVRCNSALA